MNEITGERGDGYSVDMGEGEVVTFTCNDPGNVVDIRR